MVCAFDLVFLRELERGNTSTRWRRVLVERAWSRVFWRRVRECGRDFVWSAVDQILARPDAFPYYLVRDADELRDIRAGDVMRKQKRLEWFF
jgi:hypothetical protein